MNSSIFKLFFTLGAIAFVTALPLTTNDSVMTGEAISLQARNSENFMQRRSKVKEMVDGGLNAILTGSRAMEGIAEGAVRIKEQVEKLLLELQNLKSQLSKKGRVKNANEAPSLAQLSETEELDASQSEPNVETIAPQPEAKEQEVVP